MNKIIVSDLVGKNAISMQSGEKLYRKIHPALLSNEIIELEFSKVSLYASPFFNASIGLLLKDLTVEQLQGQLRFIGLSDVGRELLNHVISNAIAYYKNSENVSAGIDKSSNDGEDHE